MNDHRVKRRRLSAEVGASSLNDDGRRAQTEGGSHAPHPSPKKIHSQSSLSRAFIGELYKSNTFKIQVDELLDQVRPDFSAIEQEIASELGTFKHAIESILDRDPETVNKRLRQGAK
jgi:U3 small nucleolar RNA-associated protein 22